MTVINKIRPINIETSKNTFSSLEELLNNIEKLEIRKKEIGDTKTIPISIKKTEINNKNIDVKRENFLDKLDPYRNINSKIKINAEKTRINSEIFGFLKQIFEQEKDNSNSEKLEILYSIIAKEVNDENNYSTLRKIINIENLDLAKIIEFAERKNNLNKVAEYISCTTEKTKEILDNFKTKIDSYGNLKDPAFIFLVFLYLKNLQ